MAETPTPKHLTIEIDFDLTTEGVKLHFDRVKAAYEAAVTAAIDAARASLPEGSVKTITSQLDWSYRWTPRVPVVRFDRDA